MLSRLPEFTIAQGSTPCLEIGMPLEMVRDVGGDVIYATIAQERSALLEFQINGSADDTSLVPSGRMEIDSDDRRLLRICFSQADTLKLEPGEVVLSIRIKREEGTDVLADTMKPITGMVVGAVKQGAI